MASHGMRVVAVGGCGSMGKFAVRTALSFSVVEKIIIADQDVERAKALAEQCGAKASAARVDVTDGASLAKLFSGAHAVLNTVGPFYRFGMQVLRAAIQAGISYLDINDDWEPTLEMLGLNERAREAGVTAIIGMGASPGISNLLAVKAIRELDRVQDVYTGWNINAAVAEPPEGGYSLDRLRAPDYQPSAAVVHGVHQLSGKIRVRRGGEFTDARPIQKVSLEYPGLGRGTAWSIGHPEPITLPRYFPDIRNSLNLFVCPRKDVLQIRLLTWLMKLRILSVRRAAILFEKDEVRKRIWEKDTMDWRYKVPRGEVPLPPLFAVAYGTREGKPAAAGAALLSAPAGKMGGLTGVPLAVGLSLLAEKRITLPGVFAPEGAIDPDSFFDALAPLCSPPKSNAKDLVLVTRSWDPAVADFFKAALR